MLSKKMLVKATRGDEDGCDNPWDDVAASLQTVINNLGSSRESDIEKEKTFRWFHRLELINNTADENILCRLTYKRNDKPYHFDFPLSVDLKEPCLQDHDNKSVKEPYVLPIVKRIPDYVERFATVLYHPFTMFVAGVVITTSALVPIFTTFGLATKIAVLVGSLVYFAPPLIHKLVKNKLRAGLLCALNDALKDVNNNKGAQAYTKINALPFVYNVMLHQYFPGNVDLKWSFNYVSSRRCVDIHLLYDAIELSETPDQLFLILRMILAELNTRRKGMLQDSMSSVTIAGHDKQNEIFAINAKRYSENIKEYVDIIPIDSTLHKELAIALKCQLMSCINSLNNCCVEEACEKFMAIEWDGYCKAAYPAAAILYYELKAVLTIASQGLDVQLNPDLFVEDRFVFARRTLDKIKRIADEFYPFKSYDYKKRIADFNSFDVEIRNAYADDEPGKPITPLAGLRKNKFVTQLKQPQQDIKVVRTANYPYLRYAVS